MMLTIDNNQTANTTRVASSLHICSCAHLLIIHHGYNCYTRYFGKHAFDHIEFLCDGEIHGLRKESALGKVHGYRGVPRHILDDYAFRGGTFKRPFELILIPERCV